MAYWVEHVFLGETRPLLIREINRIVDVDPRRVDGLRP
jgi:hypothetical protein